MTGLKPCPFCGGEAELKQYQSGDWQVICYHADGCIMCESDLDNCYWENVQTLAKQWNTRAAHGTLTAEQVEKAIHDCSTYASYDGCTYYASGIRLQAIADELNAMLCGGRVNEDSIDKWLREFQIAHGELAHIGPDELKDLAFALHDDIPLGYEASMRLGQWLLNAELGSGTLTAEQVRELIAPHLHARPTFDFGHHGAVWRADFQAIADELNAVLGSGTCENKAKHWGEFECSECGFYADFGSDLHRVNRCPDCGKAVTL